MTTPTSSPRATNQIQPDLRPIARLLAAWSDLGTLSRYVTVGGASALVEFLVFSALVYLFTLPVLAANLTATGFVIAFSFVSHKHFTFRNRDAYARQFRLFVTMLAVSILLNNLLVYLFAVILAWPPTIAKITQLGICFIWNYSISRLVVFAQGR